MKKFQNSLFLLTVLTTSILLFSCEVYANNLSITNVTLEERAPSSSTVVVEFDLSWENSWKTKINHDAIWLTVRLHDPEQSPIHKKLCQISSSGLNPTGTSPGSNIGLDLYIPDDKYGAFIYPTTYGISSSVSSSDMQVTIDFSTCGFAKEDNVHASVYGIEMVFIPEGAFYAGDYDTSNAALDEGSSDSDPWYISSESLISVSNPASDGYRYVSAGNDGEDSTGSSFSLPASFPKGFGAFYAMKYEITEGQWVDFINSLPSANARANRDLTDSSHKNSDAVKYRNTISCSGSPLTCSSSRPSRSASYLTWMDLVSYLDWMALRPMSELEYEKMARGPLLPVAGEFAWGAVDIIAATTISGSSEDGSETITNTGANVNYNDTTFSGGDSGNGADYAQGPLRGGIFATSSTVRETAGSAYYGVMELSGNLSERVVTIGNNTGRSFTATHGDGVVTDASGYEGNASNSDWPGINGTSSYGVTGAEGSGFKGGAWDDQASAARLRISDRNDAANAAIGSYNSVGGRGVRTYDGD